MIGLSEKRLVLVGPSGSGKSTLGKRLAERLGWDFLDSDREIERAAGLSIAEIFAGQGEAAFRQMERDFLLSLIAQNPVSLVLAVGGGLPVFFDNWQRLESFATIVYLSASVEVLVTRVSSSENRPLLSCKADASADSGSKSEMLKAGLVKLIEEREAIYSRARYKIDTSLMDTEKLLEELTLLLVLPDDSKGKDSEDRFRQGPD